MQETATPIEAYADTVGVRKEFIKLAGNMLPSDPKRIADAVLMLADHENPPLHLLLDHDILSAFRQKLSDWNSAIDEWEAITKDINFPPE
jgi:hypothetical protein